MKKLHYLMKYTESEPHTIVRSCLHLEKAESFRKAKQMLRKQYGDPNRIVQSFLTTLKEWKEIFKEDRTKINELYFYLNQIKNNMESMTLLHQLNNPVEILNIVRKLSLPMQYHWKQKLFDIYEKGRSDHI